MAKRRYGRKNHGPCEMECGRDIVYPRHGLCAACYGSMRIWLRKHTHAERVERLVRLALFTHRVEHVDKGALVIAEQSHHKRGRK